MANVIFDFDGTIADTLPMVVDMVNRWGLKTGPIDNKKLQELRELPMHKVIERLEIGPWRAPSLLMRGRLEMGKHIDEIPLVEGIPEVIKRLHREDHVLYIMSSNSSRNIRKFLKKNGLYHYFKRVYGGIGLFSKAKALKKVLRNNRLAIDHTIYIGDEVRDIHAAKKVGIRIISVGWGYNGVKILKTANPTALVMRPDELPPLLSN